MDLLWVIKSLNSHILISKTQSDQNDACLIGALWGVKEKIQKFLAQCQTLNMFLMDACDHFLLSL